MLPIFPIAHLGHHTIVLHNLIFVSVFSNFISIAKCPCLKFSANFKLKEKI